MSQVQILVDEAAAKKFSRLDAFLVAYLKEHSRSNIKKFFLDGLFQSQSKLELKKMPAAGVIITFNPPQIAETDLPKQNIPLEILFEDPYLIIINKPAGLVVHPAPGNPDGTLVNAILFHCPDLEGVGHERRPGIVHRLDKGTTGVMVVAKTQKCHEGLVELFSRHDIQREYLALVVGHPSEQESTVETLMARNPHNRLKMSSKVNKGKRAVTHINVLKYYKNMALTKMTLETGRTHQIRVHLSEVMRTPILNDQTYGSTKDERRIIAPQLSKLIKEYEHPFLHARLLGFIHPITKEAICVESEVPALFRDLLDILENEN